MALRSIRESKRCPRKDRNMANPVVHFEIAGKNGKQTREFYSKMFGWEYQMWGEDNYALVQAAGKENCIGGGIMEAKDFPPYLTFYVMVDDLATSLKQAESLGGKTVVPPTPIPNMGAFALFHDPDGNLVGIFHASEMQK